MSLRYGARGPRIWVPMHGPSSSRPAAALWNVDLVFYETDTGLSYFSTGFVWRLIVGSPGRVHFGDRFIGAAASTTAGVVNRWRLMQMPIWQKATITGLSYFVGATSNGQARAGLFDAAGNRVAYRAADSPQPAANLRHDIPFDAAYVAEPGIYYSMLWFSSATGTARCDTALVPASVGTDAGGIPASVAVPAAGATSQPLMTTY